MAVRFSAMLRLFRRRGGGVTPRAARSRRGRGSPAREGMRGVVGGGGGGRKSSGSERGPGTALRGAAGGGGMCPCVERRRRAPSAQPAARRGPPRVRLLAPTGEPLVRGGGGVAQRSRACALERGSCALSAPGGKKPRGLSSVSVGFARFTAGEPEVGTVGLLRVGRGFAVPWKRARRSGACQPASGVTSVQLNLSGAGCDLRKREKPSLQGMLLVWACLVGFFPLPDVIPSSAQRGNTEAVWCHCFLAWSALFDDGSISRLSKQRPPGQHPLAPS